MATDRTSSSGSDGKRKSEVVTVRLDPKLKYIAELAARRQRRTLSSYIEWAIEDSLLRVHPSHDPRLETPSSFAEVAARLWDVDEPDRFVRLAFTYPDLLDHEEQRLWKLIRECGPLWRGYESFHDQWAWDVEESSLIFERLREHWQTLQSVARGENPASALPMSNRPIKPKPDR